MKSKLQFVEPLEARIAPALLVSGGNLLGGAGNPTTGETSTGSNTVTLVKVLSGQALIFFDGGTITGISVGKHTRLDITGNIAGDIVTNLGPGGRLTDTDNNPVNGEDGGILLPISIKGITTHPLDTEKGDIGRIIAGAQINNINISGKLSGIYAGDGIFRDGSTAVVGTGSVDTNTVEQGLQNTFTFVQGVTAPNANSAIKNVTVATAAQLEIFSGSGQNATDGVGLPGSDITNVTVAKTLPAEGNKPALFIHTGDGGSGPDGGGKGGSLTGLNDQGSTAYVKIQTGNGGDSSGGEGGHGGFLQNSTVVSGSSRYDFIMGNGGNGQTGGVGGGITGLTFTNNILGAKSLVATRDFNGDGLGDVILVNTLTGATTVSLGRAGDNADRPGEANLVSVLQSVAQADGTVLQTPFLPAEGANPTSLQVTDLNGDGLLDFVVGFSSTNSLGVYINNGGGHFTATRDNLTVSPVGIAIGNFTGLGHNDIAVVGSNDTVQQSALTTGVYLLANDGVGNLTYNPTPSILLPGSASAVANLDTTLYVGFKTGSVTAVGYQNGVATPSATFFPFAKVPVNELDVAGAAGSSQLLAFSKDINAAAAAAGDTTVQPQPQVVVFGLGDGNTISSQRTLTPSAGTTTAKFLPGTNLVGTVAPDSLTFYDYNTTNQGYAAVSAISSDGALSDYDASVVNGKYQIAAAGAATNRFFFTTGNPGGAAGVAPFLPSESPSDPQFITFKTGNGGNGDALVGGTGGSIKNLNYTQTLGDGIAKAGGAYNTVLTTGTGGNSNGDVGGKGGGVRKVNLTLTPTYLTYSDDTSLAVFQTGGGGSGVTGGDGGSIQKASVTSVLTESINGVLVDGSVAVRMQTGNGGGGSGAAGGNGGNITLDGQAALQGITFVDSESVDAKQVGLQVATGNGGDGVTAGGAGGSMKNVGSQNSLRGSASVSITELGSALLSSGNGGNASNGAGGAGGTITGTNMATSTVSLPVFVNGKQSRGTSYSDGTAKDGSVLVTTGQGGTGRGGVGGAGGSINNSTLGSTIGDFVRGYGIIINSGAGGSGDSGGGTGGGVQKVIVNAPATDVLYGAVIAAGNGGDALSSGAGGAGGSIQSIKQTKDVNSTINVMQAGDGGRGAGGAGGAGGSVTGIKIAGFAGLPSTTDANNGAFFNVRLGVPTEVSSLFASAQIPQGLFAGQGADGAANGSVTDVVARQIAAIGATVQANGRFAVASEVSNITTDLIGYEVNRDGAFQSSNGQGTSPSQNTPIDGFILAAAVSDINTLDNGRTTLFTFTS